MDIPLDTVIADLTLLIPQQMKEFLVPGLSITIIRDSKIIWNQGFGVKNLQSKEFVNQNTIFSGQSLSKPVFAYAVLKLCDEGILDLDTPLCHYLPHPYLPDEPRLKLVNMRHILSHTSGFPNWREKRKTLKILYQPGEKFSYSGEGYVYLQKILEHLSDQKLQDFMKSTLFTPFKMDNTFYLRTSKDDNTGVTAYDEEGKPLTQHIRLNNAAGPLYTTPNDFAKFIIEIMHPSKPDSHHLTEALLKEMLQPQIKVNESLSWSLGWGIQHSRYRDSFFQHGKSRGFQAFSVFYIEEKIGVVIMTNSGNGLKICHEIVIQSIGGEHQSFSGFL